MTVVMTVQSEFCAPILHAVRFNLYTLYYIDDLILNHECKCAILQQHVACGSYSM